MGYLIKIAYKNIIKSKRRTILTFMMLSFGFMVYLVLDAMYAGLDVVSFKNYIEFETGHLKIRNLNFDDDDPYDPKNYLEKTGDIEAKLKKMNFVEGYTSRVLFLSELDNGTDSTSVIAVGIDPQKDKNVFNLDQYITEGGLEKNGIVLGYILARDMGLKKGDMAFITFRNIHGMFTSIEFTVSGIVKAADPRVNMMMSFINLNEAREYMDIKGATEITLKVKDYLNMQSFEKELNSNVSGVMIQNWQELSSEFAALLDMKKAAGNYILLFLLVIALVGIINTLLMSVFEKRREIGMLMALGMQKKEIRNIFIAEGLIIGILGSIFGMIMGTLANLYFIYIGIDYASLLGEDAMGFNITGHVKSAWVIGSYVKCFALVVITSILGSYVPAKRVMMFEPMECLRVAQ
ncbi:MAG: FtsX-like permease family protein [Spirochaetia bacterium]|nr:FtsX-like permease family protein [Spirochaetia bacterium]